MQNKMSDDQLPDGFQPGLFRGYKDPRCGTINDYCAQCGECVCTSQACFCKEHTSNRDEWCEMICFDLPPPHECKERKAGKVFCNLCGVKLENGACPSAGIHRPR